MNVLFVRPERRETVVTGAIIMAVTSNVQYLNKIRRKDTVGIVMFARKVSNFLYTCFLFPSLCSLKPLFLFCLYKQFAPIHVADDHVTIKETVAMIHVWVHAIQKIQRFAVCVEN